MHPNIIFILIFASFCNGQIIDFKKIQALNAIIKVLNFRKSLQQNNDVSLDCRKHLKAMSYANTTWSLQMLDAIGKPPAGIMQGSLSIFGSYDQCLSVEPFDEELGIKVFEGQYCVLTLELSEELSKKLMNEENYMKDIKKAKKKNLEFQWHLCVLSTCSDDDVINTAKTLSGMLPLNFTKATCETKARPPLTTMQIVAICVISTLGLFIIVGTILEFFIMTKNGHVYKDDKSVQVFLAFSAYSNALKLISTKTSSDNFGAIFGIRFLSLSWILLGHTYLLNRFVIGNLKIYLGYPKNLAFQVIVNGSLAVDVFFLLGGLLLSYLSMKELRKNGKINWPLFFFHRFWRLTPPQLLVLLSMFLFPLFGSGPVWRTSWEKIIEPCEKYGWKNALYINNFVTNHTKCLDHTWYLATDMQFYLISPVILYSLWRWPAYGLVVNAAFILGTIITPAYVVMKNDYVPTALPIYGQERLQDYLDDLYVKPWNRMSPYCVGIYIGYLLSMEKKGKLKPKVQAILWLVAIAVSLFPLYGTYYWNNGFESPKEVNAAYASLGRFSFALGIGWMCYACCAGYGGIINRILSWKAFVPLGRMTYMAYLIHPGVMHLLDNSLRERFLLNNFHMVVMFLGFLVLAYGVAFITSIAFEAPFVNLEKIFITKPKKKTEEFKPLLCPENEK